MNVKELFKVTGIPVVVASLCCLSPLVLLALGIGGVAFASSLADTLYGQYKWLFRGIGLLALLFAATVYWQGHGVCTFDQAKRRKNEIINSVLLLLLVGVIGYIVFLYVIVHYIGVWAGVWA